MITGRRLAAGLPGFLLLLASGSARQIPSVCGTHSEGSREAVFLHRQHTRALQRTGGIRLQTAAAAPAARDFGNIAVLDDSDGVVGRANVFDLDQHTITFRPSDAPASQYRFETGGNTYDSEAASQGTILDGLKDDDARLISLPFAFPFYGTVYRAVYVNSDGNLTFTAADADSSDRSLGRFTAGPPRIAPLFTDLDPSLPSGGRVHVLTDAAHAVISWAGVAVYSDFGIGTPQTFQVRLFATGRIEFAYNGTDVAEAVAGIAPGSLQGASTLVSFTSDPSGDYAGAVGERFSGSDQVDIITAAQKFYRTHGDSYDYLVIYNALNIDAAPGAVAYEVTVRNHRSGYGDRVVEIGQQYGSRDRLQSVLNLGPLTEYPTNPNAVVPARFVSRDTPLTIIGHEAGHLFLAFASVRDPNFPSILPMLGRANVHWSFLFNSEASFLEGNRIQDNGVNTSPRFLTTATVQGYAPLDQYLMGFRAAEEVPPTFYVDGAGIGSGSRSPQVGVTFDGQRHNVAIQDIIRADGRRTPDYTVAQRRFRFAFLLIVHQGTDPTPAQLAQIDAYRTNFETFYANATSQRATADTQLRRAVHFTAYPALGVVQGSTASATLRLESPVSDPVTFLLHTPKGFASTPPAVVIPAGTATASFSITGVNGGVEELTAEPADPAFDTAFSRVQVLPSAAGLQLSVVSGDKQTAIAGQPLPEPVMIRVADVNNLPYPNVRVVASAGSGGSVQPTAALTDETGSVSFVWTSAAPPGDQLTVSLDGNAASAVVVTSLGHPVISSDGAQNGASFTAGITPGSFASVKGSSLAAGAVAEVDQQPYPTMLAHVQVLINGSPVPLEYVSDTQINFLVPDTLSGEFADIVVSTPLGISASSRAPVVAVQPGIFVIDASGQGAVLIAGTGLTTANRPAASGDYLEIYATGLGAVRPSSTPGLLETVAAFQARIGGLPAPVIFTGLVPGWVGLYVMDAQVPNGVSSGTQNLSIVFNGVESNRVDIQIR